MDHIHLSGLSLELVIGVHAWERAAPRKLLLDLRLGLDTRAAAASDDVADTIDYAEVCERLRAHCADAAPALLETLAEDMARLLLAGYSGLKEVELTLHKPGAVPGVGVALRILRARPNQ